MVNSHLCVYSCYLLLQHRLLLQGFPPVQSSGVMSAVTTVFWYVGSRATMTSYVEVCQQKRKCVWLLRLTTSNILYHCSLKEFLPKEYTKQRGSEKKIFQVCGLHCSTITFKGCGHYSHCFALLRYKLSEFKADRAMVVTNLFFGTGTQKLRRDDGDWGKSEVCEACQILADLWRVLFSGEGKS